MTAEEVGIGIVFVEERESIKVVVVKVDDNSKNI